MRYYKVDKPSDCPWRMVLSCTYQHGGYCRPNIICGPHTVEFPENCPLPDSTADIAELVQQPTTAAKSEPYGNCPNCGVGRMRQYSHNLWRCNKCGNEATGNFS